MTVGRDRISDFTNLACVCCIAILAALATSLAVPVAHAQEVGLGGDPDAGKNVVKKCLACHTLEPGKRKIGPSLHGVVGRTPGTFEGFKFSKAMAAFGVSGAVWDSETLDRFLTSPRKLVKGTRMGFPGLKEEKDRADVIAYLKQLADQ